MEEQKTFNAQLSQRTHTVENSLNQKLDGLQSEMDQRFDNLQSEIDQQFDNLQCSISRLASQQHVHQEEECLSDTMVEEQCQQKLLLESSDIGATVCPWEKNSPMLTEEGSGKETVEGTQKPIVQPIPINLDPSAIAQPKNSPLPAASSPDPVYILPSSAAQSTPKTPVAKAKARPSLPILQNFKKLVATVQTFATTSKTLATTHTAWHNGWFGCWFKHGAPGPQQFH